MYTVSFFEFLKKNAFKLELCVITPLYCSHSIRFGSANSNLRESVGGGWAAFSGSQCENRESQVPRYLHCSPVRRNAVLLANRMSDVLSDSGNSGFDVVGHMLMDQQSLLVLKMKQNNFIDLT